MRVNEAMDPGTSGVEFVALICAVGSGTGWPLLHPSPPEIVWHPLLFNFCLPLLVHLLYVGSLVFSYLSLLERFTLGS